MELTFLQGLIDLLRANGVTKFVIPSLTLELGPAPAVVPPVDLTREGFVKTPHGRSAELQSALDRLPAIYSDTSLFDVR